MLTNVDDAAAIWNSTRIHDEGGAIVNLQKMSSNGSGIVPVLYDSTLSSVIKGEFKLIPLFYKIKLRVYTGETPLHEFGHMLGLQDLDMNNSIWIHDSLMGYGAGRTQLHYQDIQGLAVANGKHTEHDFRK